MPVGPYSLADLMAVKCAWQQRWGLETMAGPRLDKVLEEVHAITVLHFEKQFITRY